MPEETNDAVAVLVHGAWHGSWCWQPVVDELERRGHEVRTIDLPSRNNPEGDLHGDAKAVRALVDSVGRPVVLVGHSYGGAVITEASAGSSDIKRLVYLTALVPDAGETAYTAAESAAAESGGGDAAAAVSEHVEEAQQAMIAHEDGTVSCNPEAAVALFYHDCDPAVAAQAVASLVPQPAATLAQAPEGSGWKDLPSTYVVCTDDRILDLPMQQYFARRCSDTVVMDTSHSPFFSNPAGVADVVESALKN